MSEAKRTLLLLLEHRDFTLFPLSVLLIAALGFLGFRPLLASTLSVYAELKSGEAYETALVQKIAVAAEAKKNLAAVSNRLEEINAAIPAGSSQPELLQDLSLDAGRAGMAITSVFFREQKASGPFDAAQGRPEWNRIGGPIGSHVFVLTVTGAETQIPGFLRALEEGRLIEFESTQAVRRREGGKETFMITVVGRSFFIP